MSKNLNKKLFSKFYLGVADEKEKEQIFQSSESEAMLKDQWENYSQVKNAYGDMDHEKIKSGIFKQINQTNGKSGFYVHLKGFMQRYAAAILIPLFAAGLIYYFFSKPESALNIKTVEKSNPKGVRSEIILSDGSKLWLNAESKVSYPEKFSGDSRIVKLTGEAYFEVSKNEAKPFIVRTNSIDIEVLGTRFNVKSYPDEDEVETTLISGKVSIKRVHPETGELTKAILDPNQQAVYNIRNQKFSFNQVDAEKSASWIQGKLVFDSEPFKEVVKKLERWYNVEINLQQDLSMKYNFTLTITDETIEDVLVLIKKTTPDLKIEQKGNSIYISE